MTGSIYGQNIYKETSLKWGSPQGAWWNYEIRGDICDGEIYWKLSGGGQMNAAVNLILIVFAGFLVSSIMFRDTSIAKLPDQGSLHKAVLAAG